MGGKRGNNEGTIIHRQDGWWEARITLEGGKRKSFYGKTRQAAARQLAEALRDRDKGLPVISGRQTVAQYLASWLDSIKPTIRPRTWRRYEEFMRLHIIPALGTTAITKLTGQQLQLLYARKLEEGLSSTTVHHIHTALHKALDSALRLDVVQRNVSELVDPPRMRHHEMKTLSEKQARQLLQAAEGTRHEALYTVALATGMRQGELLALRWENVNLERATLQVRATVQRTRSGLEFSEPKTGYSRRQVALSRTAVEALQVHRLRQLEERLKIGGAWEDHNLVFPNEIGRPIEAGNLLQRGFYPLLKKAGLPRIRFHDLRHTAATLLLGRGVNPKIVSEMLGHADVSITLKLYSHVTPDMQQQATAAMDAALGKQ